VIGIKVEINASVRMNFAVQHLMGAARFSRRVGEIERQHQGQPFGEFWDEILHTATACVFAAVASLEAYVNETYAASPQGRGPSPPRKLQKEIRRR
jgi:hypothetical protein